MLELDETKRITIEELLFQLNIFDIEPVIEDNFGILLKKSLNEILNLENT